MSDEISRVGLKSVDAIEATMTFINLLKLVSTNTQHLIYY